jgi:muramoyltetrapeptide carboxypeptidase LdcA involved in peptidoglycan recycling
MKRMKDHSLDLILSQQISKRNSIRRSSSSARLKYFKELAKEKKRKALTGRNNRSKSVYQNGKVFTWVK